MAATEVSNDDATTALPALMQTQNVVIIGPIGAGKSTLFNQLTGCQVETGGVISLTRKAQFSFLKGRSNISIIDTPGMGSMLSESDHKRVLLSILQTVPLSLIIFAVNASSRVEDAATQCLKFWPAMYNHQDRVLFWLTNSDCLEDSKLSDYKTAFKAAMQLDAGKFRYSSKLNTEEQLLTTREDLEKTVAKHASIDLIIPSFFIKIWVPPPQPKFLVALEEFEDEWSKIFKSFETALAAALDFELRRELYLALKEQKDIIVREAYTKLEARPDMSLQEVSTAILNMEDRMYQALKTFRVTAFKTSSSLGQIYNNQQATLRACPKCDTPWLKITGCSSVRCGNRSIGPDIKVGTFTNYEITYDRAVGIVTTAPTPVTAAGVYREKEFFGKQPHEDASVKPVGCGHSFKWEDAQDVTSKYQTELRDVFISDFGTDRQT